MRLSSLIFTSYFGLYHCVSAAADDDGTGRSLQEKQLDKTKKESPNEIAPLQLLPDLPLLDVCPNASTSLPFRFGMDAGDIYTLPNDDGSSAPVALTTPMLFLGQEYSVAYQNTNGHISFQQPESSFFWQFLPTADLGPLAAAYWTDIYTGNNGLCRNDMWFRYSQLAEDTETASTIIRQATASSDFTTDAVLVATWYRVDSLLYQNESATFQLVMAWEQEGNATWAIMAYDELQFTIAASGFNDGLGVRGGMANIIDTDSDAQSLLEGSNIGLPGLYAYKVDQDFESDIVPPTEPPTVAPTPCGVPPEADVPFPFGSEVGDYFTGPNDDGSSIPVEMSVPVRFLGNYFDVAYQNTNGHVSFGNSSYRYYWEYLPSPSVEPLAAILWTDIFTGANGGCRNELWIRYSQNAHDLATASELLRPRRPCHDDGSSKGGSHSLENRRHLKGSSQSTKGRYKVSKYQNHDFLSMPSSKGGKGFSKYGSNGGHRSCPAPFDAVLVATWYRVESFGGIYEPSGTDTFQMAFAWNRDETWAIFSYDQLDFFGSSQRGSAIGFNGLGGENGGLLGVADSPEDAEILMSGSNIGHPGTFAFEISDSFSMDEAILDVPPETEYPTVYPYFVVMDGKEP